ncbi:MAG: HD domain-containing protein [Calditrichae bacterium]|nr:HD domain-containing protein [Calditrichia bacterium]
MMKLTPTSGQAVLRQIHEAAVQFGVEVYAVGGFVRDLVMGKEGKDIDCVVLGDAIGFARHFRKMYHSSKVVPFAQFGTARVQYQDWQLEFVTAREEHYQEDSRKPEVRPATLESDLSRRDFTINCLAMDISPEHFGEVIDLFDGEEDIRRQLIRTPLDPQITFSDDPLRILRAIRFAATLGFHIDGAALQAIHDNRERLRIISQERITEEFRKLMLADKPSTGLELLRDTGVSAIIFPELDQMAGVEQRQEYQHKDVFYHTLQVLDNISEHTGRFELRMVALMHDIAKPQTKKFIAETGWTFHGHEELGAKMAQRIGRRMKLPTHTIKYISKLVRLHMRPSQLVDDDVTDSAIRRLMYEAGDEIDDLMMMCRADITSKNPRKVERYLNNFDRVEQRMIEVEERDRIRNFQPALDGNAIMQHLNMKPGPVIGKIKQAITDAILDGIIPNEYQACFDYFMQIKDQIIAEEA